MAEQEPKNAGHNPWDKEEQAGALKEAYEREDVYNTATYTDDEQFTQKQEPHEDTHSQHSENDTPWQITSLPNAIPTISLTISPIKVGVVFKHVNYVIQV